MPRGRRKVAFWGTSKTKREGAFQPSAAASKRPKKRTEDAAAPAKLGQRARKRRARRKPSRY